MRTITVGTRRSELALTQTNWVIERLQELAPSFSYQREEIVTRGDRILNVTLSKIGGKGLFVKEIEEALLDGRIDLAVHSMKDMPARLPDGLVIGAVTEREFPGLLNHPGRPAFIGRVTFWCNYRYQQSPTAGPIDGISTGAYDTTCAGKLEYTYWEATSR